MAMLCGTSEGKMKMKMNTKTMKYSWTARGSTDSSGEFQIDVPSHLHAIPNLEKICHVRVVHLPTTCPCGGKAQMKPIKLASIGEGIRNYTTADIHLMPRIKVKGQHIRTSTVWSSILSIVFNLLCARLCLQLVNLDGAFSHSGSCRMCSTQNTSLVN